LLVVISVKRITLIKYTTMPGFDPDEPRDAFGKWVETTSNRAKAETKRAASDKKPADISTYEDQVKKLLTPHPNENPIISLKGLTEQEAADVVEVLDDMTNGGVVDVPITNVYVCGQEYNFNCTENSDAGAFYGFDWETKTGSLYINPEKVHTDFVYQETPTWKEKYDKTTKMLNDLDNPDFVDEHHLSERAVEMNKAFFAQLQLRYKYGMEEKKPDIPNNASLVIKDSDKRFKSVVYHEMGHMVLKKDFFELHPKARGRSSDWGQTSIDYKEWRDHNLPVKEPNSDYGASNSDEYFAEWYGAYKSGIAKKIPKEVKTIIDRNPL
jgi:hypothetical protein